MKREITETKAAKKRLRSSDPSPPPKESRRADPSSPPEVEVSRRVDLQVRQAWMSGRVRQIPPPRPKGTRRLRALDLRDGLVAAVDEDARVTVWRAQGRVNVAEARVSSEDDVPRRLLLTRTGVEVFFYRRGTMEPTRIASLRLRREQGGAVTLEEEEERHRPREGTPHFEVMRGRKEGLHQLLHLKEKEGQSGSHVAVLFSGLSCAISEVSVFAYCHACGWRNLGRFIQVTPPVEKDVGSDVFQCMLEMVAVQGSRVAVPMPRFEVDREEEEEEDSPVVIYRTGSSSIETWHSFPGFLVALDWLGFSQDRLCALLERDGRPSSLSVQVLDVSSNAVIHDVGYPADAETIASFFNGYGGKHARSDGFLALLAPYALLVMSRRCPAGSPFLLARWFSLPTDTFRTSLAIVEDSVLVVAAHRWRPRGEGEEHLVYVLDLQNLSQQHQGGEQVLPLETCVRVVRRSRCQEPCVAQWPLSRLEGPDLDLEQQEDRLLVDPVDQTRFITSSLTASC